MSPRRNGNSLLAVLLFVVYGHAQTLDPPPAATAPDPSVDRRPVREAWGTEASIASCFENSKIVRVAEGGESGSDISRLVDTSKTTLHDRVTAVRVCTLPT